MQDMIKERIKEDKIWKEFLIIPLFKSGTRGNVSNYRPIAKLSAIPKLFEAMITKSVMFNIKSIICPQQHGFMGGRSTTTNLLLFVWIILLIGDRLFVYSLTLARHSTNCLIVYCF